MSTFSLIKYGVMQNNNFLTPKGSCARGHIECGNGDGNSKKCCNDPNCDLDRVKSLPWDENLGLSHDCYRRCDENMCYNTS